MRTFACPVCRRLAPFEAVRCVHCDAQLGFDWDAMDVRDVHPAAGRRRCANHEEIGCTGLVAEEGALCRACALTTDRPNAADADGVGGWAVAEKAKRRLVYELVDLELPADGLSFRMLSSAGEPVVTGHADGVITLDLAEADDAHRERVRVQMGEPYRTLLGHLRHETSHALQPALVPAGSPDEPRMRALFGDEREDYQAAIDRHYAQGAPEDWPDGFVSAYATMHPWEDWAETCAHYLHIRDALQTAAAYGVVVEGPSVDVADPVPLQAEPDEEPTGRPGDVQQLLADWLPLSYALNALNRSMGAPDLYPFVLGPRVAEKLGFVDELVRGRARPAPAGG